MPEHQNIEYKESWRDEYLKWICGFANANGGKIFIGIDDKGIITGLSDYKKLMEDIPNKVVNHLGLVVDVNLSTKAKKHFIEIVVPQSEVPISYHGNYHYRSGSTKQELKGTSLHQFLLKKMGRSWENLPIPSASFDDLNKTTIASFLNNAIEKDRIPAEAAKDKLPALFKNLELTNKQGELTNAALLLFGKRPSMVSVTANFKIGRFGHEDHDLKFQDIIETNIFDMPDKILEILKTKYLIRPISYKGLERMEPLEYPEPALREAILNAVMHKDYSSTYIFLRVYDDKLNIWNPGTLPEELTIEKLKTTHSSYPRNKIIASIFFKAGYIEAWGRGTNKIIQSCVDAGLPEPVIEENMGGIGITFLKDIYTEEYLRKLDINDRQFKGIMYIKEKGFITNTIFQSLNHIGKSVTTIELQDLVNKKIIRQEGKSGRAVKYRLKR